MTIQARFPGTCGECGGRFQPGDPIRSDADLGPEGAWRHDVCPDDDPLTPTHPVCTVCWLTHPEGACDR